MFNYLFSLKNSALARIWTRDLLSTKLICYQLSYLGLDKHRKSWISRLFFLFSLHIPCWPFIWYSTFVLMLNQILTFFQNPKNYCRDPDCPEGCDPDHGECNEPNVCTCKVGYYGQACQVIDLGTIHKWRHSNLCGILELVELFEVWYASLVICV